MMNKPDSFQFHSYDLGETSSFRQVRFLFNSVKNLQLQPSKRWRIFEIIEKGSGSVKARIAVSLGNGEALSPVRAPFGFIEIYKKTNQQELYDFFQFMETDLMALGITMMQLKSYPEIYDAHFKSIEVALNKMRYSSTEEISSVILVDDIPFEKKIKVSEHQKLRKATKLFFSEKVKMSRLYEMYSFIEDCRKERNQNLSMSFNDLEKAVTTFPKNFFLFHVYNKNETAAAAIVIKVNKDILYTFYYAHARKFDNMSPVVLLISSIYKWADDAGIKYIDLGTSMLNGKINRSLLHFKKSIGGHSSRKLIFEKKLA